MKLFYTASFYGKAKYQEYYDLVLKSIKQTGVELLSPEVGNYLSVLKLEDYAKIKSKKKLHYEAIRRGIVWAQAVVIEASHEDFQLGHEATLAIQGKKPVLCLSIHEDFSKKISNPYFFGAKYNEYNIEELLGEFVKRHEKETLNQRFNLFLSSRQLKNLEEASKKMGMNNSEYLRTLIDKNS
jgi:hypothetical protein